MYDADFTPASWLAKTQSKAEGILDGALEDIEYLIREMS